MNVPVDLLKVAGSVVLNNPSTNFTSGSIAVFWNIRRGLSLTEYPKLSLLSNDSTKVLAPVKKYAALAASDNHYKLSFTVAFNTLAALTSP